METLGGGVRDRSPLGCGGNSRQGAECMVWGGKLMGKKRMINDDTSLYFLDCVEGEK